MGVRSQVVSKLTMPGGLMPELKECDFWNGSRCGEYLGEAVWANGGCPRCAATLAGQYMEPWQLRA